MQYSEFRLWRIWIPLAALLAGCFLVVLLWPDVIPSTRYARSSAEDSSGFSFARAPWTEGAPLRVGAPEPVRQATVISPYGPGFEIELVNTFCEIAFCTPEWVNVPTKDAGLTMLRRGEIDVLVGFWGDGLNASAAGSSSVTAGTAYAHFNPVRISGAEMAGASPYLGGDGQPEARNAKNGASSLDALSRAFSALIPALVGSPSSESGPAGQPFPVFSLATDGKSDSGEDIMLIDPASYALWLPFMGDVDSCRAKRQTPYRWFWRNDKGMLAKRFEIFWNSPERAEELAELTERYFGFLPRNLRQGDIRELADTLASRLPLYEKFIMKAVKETGVPPLLLVAVIYQESRFDPDAVSETGVRGIMQLTASTAQMLNVDRKDPEQCIMGGARYLRDLWDRIGDKAENDWDRWFMALAAYNQGIGNLNKTIKQAQNLGDKGDSWTDLKRVFPLSTTCRGLEAKSFVEHIRYYNFILHGLVALAPPETQDFAPLLGLAVVDSGR